jgi:protein TilB
VTSHTPEDRLKAARELEKLRKKETNHLEKKKEPKQRLMYGPDGRVLQRNEGKYEYRWEDTKKCIRLLVEISKFLDTSFINIDCYPGYITIMIKDKMLQLVFDEAVRPDTMHCERSKLTGQLAITIVKESFTEVVDVTKELGKVAIVVKFATSDKHPKIENKRYQNLFTPKEAVDYRNIVKENAPSRKSQIKVGNITEQMAIKPMVEPDFVDDPDVPPLC